jgi:branched-chain amino acid transport system substrate-binding protein
MKRIAFLILILSLLLGGCGSKFECTDPQVCVTVKSGEPITIAVALTLSGPNATYGVEALRGVEMAIADRGKLLNRDIELIKEDDLCSAKGGQAAAERLAQNPNLAGVIGATCSSASAAAAEVLTQAGIVMISPSSSAASLTSKENHQPGFLRTATNDKSQAKMVADFAYEALGARTMATIQTDTPDSDELRTEVCTIFTALGGKCVESYILASGTNPKSELSRISIFKPEVLYFPLFLADGVAVIQQAAAAGLEDTALIGADALLASNFIAQTKGFSEGMYISGPALSQIDPAFLEKYKARYSQEPISAHAARAYDATMLLFNAVTISAKTTGRDIYLMRQNIMAALYAIRDYQGVSGTITCSDSGDCATPNFVIYQVRDLEFKNIYP